MAKSKVYFITAVLHVLLEDLKSQIAANHPEKDLSISLDGK